MALAVILAAFLLVAALLGFGAYALHLTMEAEENERIEELEERVEELEAEKERLERERMALVDELGREDVDPEEFELADEEV